MYDFYSSLIEGEAILTLHEQAKHSTYYPKIMDYIDARNRMHLWTAAKLAEIRDLLVTLEKRWDDILSIEEETYYLRLLHNVIKKVTSDSAAFSQDLAFLKFFVRQYAIMHREGSITPMEAIPLIIEDLNGLKQARPQQIREFLTKFFLNEKYFSKLQNGTNFIVGEKAECLR
jgi:hypothetical protein